MSTASDKTIPVVVYIDNILYRHNLPMSKVATSSNGQLILPERCYSKGFYERQTDSNWTDLPEMPINGQLDWRIYCDRALK